MDQIERTKYFREFFAMASTPGWATLMQDLASVREELNRIDSCQDEKEFWIRKGRVMQLSHLLGYEQAMEQMRDNED